MKAPYPAFDNLTYDEIVQRDDAIFVLYVRNNKEELAKGLEIDSVRAGLDRKFFGHTIITYAVMDNRPGIVQLLLEYGADTTIPADGTGLTPLHYAVGYKLWVIVTLFMAADKRFLKTAGIKDAEGYIPEDYAMRDFESMLMWARLWAEYYTPEQQLLVRGEF